MTENKRYSFNWERGHPNFWDNHCDLADCYLTCEDVVDRLNDLHDENKKLKMFLKAFDEELDLANRDCDILEEENEQLKKENYELHKRLGDFESFEEHIKERTSKTSVNDIVGLVKTNEPTDTVELKRS